MLGNDSNKIKFERAYQGMPGDLGIEIDAVFGLCCGLTTAGLDEKRRFMLPPRRRHLSKPLILNVHFLRHRP